MDSRNQRDRLNEMVAALKQEGLINASNFDDLERDAAATRKSIISHVSSLPPEQREHMIGMLFDANTGAEATLITMLAAKESLSASARKAVHESLERFDECRMTFSTLIGR